MFSTKDSKHLKEIRLNERKEWRKFQIVINGYRALGFDYVIKRLPPARVCFGSSLQRTVMPHDSTKDMSPLMRRLIRKTSFITDNNLNESNTNTRTIINENKNTKKRTTCGGTNRLSGYGPLVSKTPRFLTKSTVSNEKVLYNARDHEMNKPIKKSKQPFGRSLKEKLITSDTPGPGVYVDHSRKLAYKYSFGGPIRMIPAVDTVCTVAPNDKCYNCGIFPLLGDYWKQSIPTIITLCHSCWIDERNQAIYHSKSVVLKQKRLNELDLFRKTRYCGFYHDHNNTTSSVTLLTKLEYNRKYRRENYLAMFGMY